MCVGEGRVVEGLRGRPGCLLVHKVGDGGERAAGCQDEEAGGLAGVAGWGLNARRRHRPCNGSDVGCDACSDAWRRDGQASGSSARETSNYSELDPVTARALETKSGHLRVELVQSEAISFTDHLLLWLSRV